jgi:hypothetical protein
LGLNNKELVEMKLFVRLVLVAVVMSTTTGWSILPSSSNPSNDGFAIDVPTVSNKEGVVKTVNALKVYAEKTPTMNMLSNMEYGELLRINKQYAESNQYLLKADDEIKKWEEKTNVSAEKLATNIVASILSEEAKIYEGQDYEKVWLTTNLALNKIATGDFDGARVDIKRTHEREKIIAKYKEQELSIAEKEAKDKGAEIKNKELNGYPVESINDPEVLKLKNGYQNALSHYLAGFLYESLNEPGLAAPGYRKAIELKPETKILEDGLSDLDKRTSLTHKKHQKMTDVLFVVETGLAPQRTSTNFTMMLPSPTGLQTVAIDYPVINPSSSKLMSALQVDNTSIILDDIVDNNLMARRALKDDMPAMMLRSTTRAIAKGVATQALDQATGGFGSLFSGLVDSVTSAGPKAGEKMWHTLPERVYIARTYLASGEHTIENKETGEKFVFQVNGQYALVPIRLVNDGGFLGNVGTIGKLAQ